MAKIMEPEKREGKLRRMKAATKYRKTASAWQKTAAISLKENRNEISKREKLGGGERK
jgi:hypothetical protein